MSTLKSPHPQKESSLSERGGTMQAQQVLSTQIKNTQRGKKCISQFNLFKNLTKKRKQNKKHNKKLNTEFVMLHGWSFFTCKGKPR